MQPPQLPLDQLADIRLPEPVSWWPLAPGWWILLALILCTALAFFFWRRRIKRNRYRTLAARELDQIFARYQSDQDAARFLHEASVLLRRTALTAYPATFDPTLKGQAWLDWLDSVCPTKKGQEHLRFTAEPGQQMLAASYQKAPKVDGELIYRASRFWLTNHRSSSRPPRILPNGSEPQALRGTNVEAKHV